jgi:hypothetical protein
LTDNSNSNRNRQKTRHEIPQKSQIAQHLAVKGDSKLILSFATKSTNLTASGVDSQGA